ncbi:hypothetical protein FA13DRAFT_1625068, partial [Coprinellus micaceus]
MTTPWRARSKQERTRRTLQQLEELEAVFASNRYPTTGIKASLADKFGITLRQIQVWFQNRVTNGATILPHVAQRGSAIPDFQATVAQGADILTTLHESSPVIAIPSESVTVGSWRYLSSHTPGGVLTTYICRDEKKVSWLVRESENAFKMSIPFDTIVDVTLDANGVSPPSSSAAVTIRLSRPPSFFFWAPFMSRSWQSCDDWTEGRQGTLASSHCLRG